MIIIIPFSLNLLTLACMICLAYPINPLTTGVENECWLRGMVHLDNNLPNVIWLGFGQVESYLFHTLSEKAKNNINRFRTRADRLWRSTVLPPEPIWLDDEERLIFIATFTKFNDRILKTGKNNNFRPKSIYDLISYFRF